MRTVREARLASPPNADNKRVARRRHHGTVGRPRRALGDRIVGRTTRIAAWSDVLKFPQYAARDSAAPRAETDALSSASRSMTTPSSVAGCFLSERRNRRSWVGVSLTVLGRW